MRFRRAISASWKRRRKRCAAAAVATLAISGAITFGATGATAATAVETVAPFTYPGENPCVVPAESFVGTGRLHFLVGGNLSGGGMAQSHLEANLQSVQAITATGKKYVVVDSTSQTLVFDTTDAAPFETTWVWTVQYVRAGENGTPIGGDDFYQRIVAHATVNAKGVVTVERFTSETRCR